LAIFGDRAVIVVPPSLALRARLGIELIPLSGGRALISFDETITVSEIELRLGDALADPTFQPSDREVFEALAGILRTARRDGETTLARRSIIVLHLKKSGSTGPRRRRDAKGTATVLA
jgi:hypothetical protein